MSVVLGPLPVNEVQTSSLELSIDEGSCQPSEDLFGLCVARRLSILGAVLLVRLGGLWTVGFS